MPRSRSVHGQLDELRQAAAHERVRARELETELNATNLRAQEADAALAAGYAAEDDRAVKAARKATDTELAKARELDDRIAGVRLRVEQADRAVDKFTSGHADELLRELEDTARQTAASLTSAAHEAVRLHRQYRTDRQAIQEAVAQIAPGAGAPDGPPSTYPSEAALKELERAVRQTSEAPAPLPRWLHRDWRTQQNEVAAREQQRRRLRRQKERV